MELVEKKDQGGKASRTMGLLGAAWWVLASTSHHERSVTGQQCLSVQGDAPG